MKRASMLGVALLVGAFGAAEARPGHKNVKVHTITMGFGGGQLGVQVQDLTEELREFFGADKDSGILVGRVEKGSPAVKAGVKVGDVIVEVDGKAVEGTHDVWGALAGKSKGDKVSVTVIRKKAKKELTATLDDDAVDFGQLWGMGGGMGHGRTIRVQIPDVQIPDVQIPVDLDDMMKKVGKAQAWSWRFDDEGGVDELIERLEKLEKRLEQLERK